MFRHDLGILFESTVYEGGIGLVYVSLCLRYQDIQITSNLIDLGKISDYMRSIPQIMDFSQLTRFQHSAERALTDLLAELGRQIDSREVLRGTIPFFSKESQTALRLTSRDLEVMLYDDEATFKTGKASAGFERADFSSQDDLLAEMIARLRKALAS